MKITVKKAKILKDDLEEDEGGWYEPHI